VGVRFAQFPRSHADFQIAVVAVEDALAEIQRDCEVTVDYVTVVDFDRSPKLIPVVRRII
jgi:hypothetical protein